MLHYDEIFIPIFCNIKDKFNSLVPQHETLSIIPDCFPDIFI